MYASVEKYLYKLVKYVGGIFFLDIDIKHTNIKSVACKMEI